MKKKILALCLVVVLAVTAVTGATLAYFTDTEQKTNTMTIGNVEINIEELAKDPTTGAFEAFDDNDFTLYPLESAKGMPLFNKMAYTFNTSSSKDDAYIRTIVLFEANDLLDDAYANEGGCCPAGIHYAYSGSDYTFNGKNIHGCAAPEQLEETVTIGGEEYYVVVFTAADEKAIPYGEALEALNSVWMDKGITSEQIAGWGEDVDIIVFSQGIQSEGLTHAEAMEALGVVNEENLAAWIGADDAEINDVF